MTSNLTRSPHLDTSQQFKERMKKGKVYEARVQEELEKHSRGEVFKNIKISQLCEFDAVIVDYPLVTLIEIKFYRPNLIPSQVRQHAWKLQRICNRIMESSSQCSISWCPYHARKRHISNVTFLEVLYSKLGLTITEGWKFRMMLIVPKKSYNLVLASLRGDHLKANCVQILHNVIGIKGIPLIVIPEKRIEEVFG